MLVTERPEHEQTQKALETLTKWGRNPNADGDLLDDALQEISDWLRPGTNEGATFSLARVSDVLFAASWFGGRRHQSLGSRREAWDPPKSGAVMHSCLTSR